MVTERDAALDYVMRFVGTWYRWGGDDPSGFDCSGLVVEYLKSIGLMERGADLTARGIWELLYFRRHEQRSAGGLVFYATGPEPGSVCHVEIILDDKCQLGASGGGSRVRTVEDAIAQNAFIKRRPIGSNRGLIVAGYVRLFNKGGQLIIK